MSRERGSRARAAGYEHTQSGIIHWLLVLLGAACAVASAAVLDQGVVALVLLGTGLLFGLLALGFAHLTVRDRGDHLEVRFGPLPLLRARVPYEGLADVRRGRSRWIDGWGVHWSPGRGWIYNLWGFDCVELELAGRRLRIGTDDPENLARFLRTKLP